MEHALRAGAAGLLACWWKHRTSTKDPDLAVQAHPERPSGWGSLSGTSVGTLGWLAAATPQIGTVESQIPSDTEVRRSTQSTRDGPTLNTRAEIFRKTTVCSIRQHRQAEHRPVLHALQCAENVCRRNNPWFCTARESRHIHAIGRIAVIRLQRRRHPVLIEGLGRRKKARGVCSSSTF